MTLLEQALALDELLSDPARWAKKYYAYNAEGMQCDADDPEAVCWCLDGAVFKVVIDPESLQGDTTPLTRLINDAIAEVSSIGHTVFFNDAVETTHADIRRLTQRVVELANAS